MSGSLRIVLIDLHDVGLAILNGHFNPVAERAFWRIRELKVERLDQKRILPTHVNPLREAVGGIRFPGAREAIGAGRLRQNVDRPKARLIRRNPKAKCGAVRRKSRVCFALAICSGRDWIVIFISRPCDALRQIEFEAGVMTDLHSRKRRQFYLPVNPMQAIAVPEKGRFLQEPAGQGRGTADLRRLRSVSTRGNFGRSGASAEEEDRNRINVAPPHRNKLAKSSGAENGLAWLMVTGKNRFAARGDKGKRRKPHRRIGMHSTSVVGAGEKAKVERPWLGAMRRPLTGTEWTVAGERVPAGARLHLCLNGLTFYLSHAVFS